MPKALKKTAKNSKIAKTAKPAKSSRRVIKPWTKEDVRTLKAHSKARTPVTKVSKVMKRTVGALRRRAGILGVGLGHRR
jgi:hypothetical protein